MDKILLIDAENFIWRANIKFGKEQSEYVIVYNFFRNLKALVEQFSPNKVFFCTESFSNFRKTLSNNYKKNRIIKNSSKSPDHLFNKQREIIYNLIQYLPIIKTSANGFEADDVIATLANNLIDEETIIVSNDKDYIQLLQNNRLKNLKLYNPFKKEFVSAPTYHFATFLALNGDISDNIQSLVSKEKAITMATNPKDLLNFLSSEENRSNYKLNYDLVKLRIIDNDKLEISDYALNFNLLKEEFGKMEFNSMLEHNYWNSFCNVFKTIH